MPNPMAVAEIPYIKRFNMEVNNPGDDNLSARRDYTSNIEQVSGRYTDNNYGLINAPAYRFSTNPNKKMRLQLAEVNVRHVGVAASDNKTIRVIKRSMHPRLTPAPNSVDWDYPLLLHNGNEITVSFTELDFGKPVFDAGDSLLIVWNNAINAEANIDISFKQVY